MDNWTTLKTSDEFVFPEKTRMQLEDEIDELRLMMGKREKSWMEDFGNKQKEIEEFKLYAEANGESTRMCIKACQHNAELIIENDKLKAEKAELAEAADTFQAFFDMRLDEVISQREDAEKWRKHNDECKAKLHSITTDMATIQQLNIGIDEIMGWKEDAEKWRIWRKENGIRTIEYVISKAEQLDSILSLLDVEIPARVVDGGIGTIRPATVEDVKEKLLVFDETGVFVLKDGRILRKKISSCEIIRRRKK